MQIKKILDNKKNKFAGICKIVAIRFEKKAKSRLFL